MTINHKNFYLLFLLLINSTGALILSAIVVKVFGIEFFGKYSYTFNIVQIATTMALMGTDNFLLRETSVDLSSKNINVLAKRYIDIKYLILLISSLICLSAVLISFFFLEKVIVHMLIVIIPISLTRLNHSVLKSFQSQALIILTDKLLLNLSLLFISFSFYYFDIYKESLFINVFLFIFFLNYFLSIKRNLFCINTFSNFSFKINFNYIKKSNYFFLSKISTVVIKHADIIVLGTLLTPHELGVYAVLSRLVVSSNIFMSLFNSIESPIYASLHHSNNTRLLLNRFYRTSFILGLIGLFQLTILLLFKILIFSIWSIDITNFNYLIILMVGQLINLMSGNCGVLLNMTGSDKPQSRINLISLLLYIPTLVFSTITFGLIGSVYVITLYHVMVNISKIYLIQIKFR